MTTLSGGEAQRVALARALAPRPGVLLLDEPLGALDGPLRQRLQDDLRDLFERLSLTVVHVTHDVGEAFALGTAWRYSAKGGSRRSRRPRTCGRGRPTTGSRASSGWGTSVRNGDRATVTRPDAVRVKPGSGATVLDADRDGPVVRLRVRLADGIELHAVSVGDTPAPGDTVSVEIEQTGVIQVAVWRGSLDSAAPRE